MEKAAGLVVVSEGMTRFLRVECGAGADRTNCAVGKLTQNYTRVILAGMPTGSKYRTLDDAVEAMLMPTKKADCGYCARMYGRETYLGIVNWIEGKPAPTFRKFTRQRRTKSMGLRVVHADSIRCPRCKRTADISPVRLARLATEHRGHDSHLLI